MSGTRRISYITTSAVLWMPLHWSEIGIEDRAFIAACQDLVGVFLHILPTRLLPFSPPHPPPSPASLDRLLTEKKKERRFHRGSLPITTLSTPPYGRPASHPRPQDYDCLTFAFPPAVTFFPLVAVRSRSIAAQSRSSVNSTIIKSKRNTLTDSDSSNLVNFPITSGCSVGNPAAEQKPRTRCQLSP